ncbi:hypothetical protein BDZ89DRAFT_697734 [Hymenopellis radicata]|nr:hypothetical protein BDZ89DRAFT_697734 [Hymenopellis radicata]
MLEIHDGQLISSSLQYALTAHMKPLINALKIFSPWLLPTTVHSTSNYVDLCSAHQAVHRST